VNVFLLLGFTFLGVGVLGVFLPILPATPFILLAAACFARSSEKWHRWLLANETFGPMVRNWEQNRCVGCRVKAVAILSMLAVGGYSVFFALESDRARILGIIIIGIGLLTVTLLRTCRARENDAPLTRMARGVDDENGWDR
jgi:uncharacterized membrane protein YbaN (DUF454 family)